MFENEMQTRCAICGTGILLGLIVVLAHLPLILLMFPVTVLFLGIQTSIPLSLGLLGALSFVRFRTPVKDPAEIGFLLVLIACRAYRQLGLNQTRDGAVAYRSLQQQNLSRRSIQRVLYRGL